MPVRPDTLRPGIGSKRMSSRKPEVSVGKPAEISGGARSSPGSDGSRPAYSAAIRVSAGGGCTPRTRRPGRVPVGLPFSCTTTPETMVAT